MRYPVLSIITINKDNSLGLAKTISSFCPLKDNEDVEFLLIDGESKDNSVLAADRFYCKEKIFSEPDSGIYNAMNKGLYRSKGKYVLWINSGDQIIQNEVLNILNTLRWSSASLIACGVDVISHIDNRLINTWYPKYDDLPLSTFPHQGCFFLRRDLLSMGGYNESFRYAGDRELIVRMLFLEKKIDITSFTVARFYTGGVSFTQNAMLEGQLIDKKYRIVNPVLLLWRRYRYRYNWFLGPIKRALFSGG